MWRQPESQQFILQAAKEEILEEARVGGERRPPRVPSWRPSAKQCILILEISTKSILFFNQPFDEEGRVLATEQRATHVS
jgi:hypothetical protein